MKVAQKRIVRGANVDNTRLTAQSDYITSGVVGSSPTEVNLAFAS
ncbi:hypothetical protein RMSM_04492 [Rhodopirellula maiorica SM1]|uniref:Uncharacterized protein n=1 Tax=Rhodopirellula maiorica SM1 TaxID=1265738 RepID=M5RXB0_9BACT|nr:hypothetical protein RMSM_04492 [Rhodopirellula maiorica SM1]